jgi:predicted nucleic acid-binding protein
VSKGYLLDTSALLAYMEKEAGDERVKSILKAEKAFIPWTALAELYYITHRKNGEAVAEFRYAILKRTGAHIIWQADETILISVGRIKATHRVSFTDALIASYAIKYNAILVHKDPEYEALNDKVEMEALPYKND